MKNASHSAPRPLWIPRLLALLALAMAAVLAGAGPALAHDPVVSTAPQKDTTVSTTLTEVSVTFAEAPLAVAGARIGLEVTGPSGTSVATGDVRVNGATISRSISPTAAGAYTVQYQSVSTDGHNTSGEFAFTYQGPLPTPTPTASATPSAAPTASASAPTAVSTAGPAPSAEPTSASAQTGLVVGAIVGILVVIGAIVAIIISVRRRGRMLPPGGDTGA